MMSMDLAKIQARLEHKRVELQAHIHTLREEPEMTATSIRSGKEAQVVDLFPAYAQHATLMLKNFSRLSEVI